jgi:hypothetical protein
LFLHDGSGLLNVGLHICLNRVSEKTSQVKLEASAIEIRPKSLMTEGDIYARFKENYLGNY